LSFFSRLFDAIAPKRQPFQKADFISGPDNVGAFATGMLGANARTAGPSVSDMDTYWMLFCKHPWVRTCVSYIAEAVAAEGFSIIPVDGVTAAPASEREDERLGQLHQFFANCTPNSTFTDLRLSTAIDLRVHSVAYWRKDRVSKRGLPRFFERIDPRIIRPRLAKDRKSIDGFVIRSVENGGLVGADAKVEIVDPNDIVFFKMAGGDPLLGMPSPLEALDITIDQDWKIRNHQRAFFRNGGVSGRVILMKGITPEAARKLTKELKAEKTGVEAAFADLCLAGDNIEVKESSASSGKNELDFLKGSEAARNEIAAVFKVPVGMLAFAAGALGSAGKEQDDDSFQRYAVLPVERAIYDTLTRDVLVGDFGITDLRLVPQRLQQIRLDRFGAAKTSLEAGATVNEARAIVGLPSVDGSGQDCDVPLVMNRQPIAAAEVTATGDKGGDVTELDDQLKDQDA